MVYHPPTKKRKYARYAEELPNKGIGSNIQKHVIGGKELTKEEYETAKGQMGFKSGKGGILTPGVKEAVENVRLTEEKIRTPPKSAELVGLEQTQVEELKKIDELKSSKPQLTTSERNIAAGIATSNILGATLGMEQGGDPYAQVQELTGLGRKFYGTVGIVATSGFGEWRLSSLFAPQSANIKNLESDASAAKSESTRIMRAALTKGADIQMALDSQIRLEEGIRSKYLDAMQSLRNSPKDIREGLDLIDGMSRDLRVVMENRQAMERYKLTLNPSEISVLIGTGIEEE